MKKMTIEKITELKRLLAAVAAPGPYVMHDPQIEECGVDVGSTATNEWIVNVKTHVGNRAYADGWVERGVPVENAAAFATFLVEALNALPELLDIAAQQHEGQRTSSTIDSRIDEGH